MLTSPAILPLVLRSDRMSSSVDLPAPRTQHIRMMSSDAPAACSLPSYAVLVHCPWRLTVAFQELLLLLHAGVTCAVSGQAHLLR